LWHLPQRQLTGRQMSTMNCLKYLVCTQDLVVNRRLLRLPKTLSLSSLIIPMDFCNPEMVEAEAEVSAVIGPEVVDTEVTEKEAVLIPEDSVEVIAGVIVDEAKAVFEVGVMGIGAEEVRGFPEGAVMVNIEEEVKDFIEEGEATVNIVDEEEGADEVKNAEGLLHNTFYVSTRHR